MSLLQQDYMQAMKMISRLKHLSCEERLKVLMLFCLDKNLLQPFNL